MGAYPPPEKTPANWLREAALEFLKCDWRLLDLAEDIWREWERDHDWRQKDIKRECAELFEWAGPWAVKCRYRYLKSIGKTEEAKMLYAEADKHAIERARQVPLYEYLGLERGKRIPCPFHDGEGLNFSVREIGHCFTCGANADSIRYAMEIDGLTFGHAVGKINGK